MRGLCLFFISFIAFSCSVIKPDSTNKSILFDINGSPVYTEEFMYNFSKNADPEDSATSKQDIDEYLELYINFKLKVMEATTEGLDTTQAFNKEFTKYKNQLTDSYLKDDSIIINLVQEAYERLKYELDVSHIIISIENTKDPNDTLIAFHRINEISERLESGEDFEKLAITYSEDPSVESNKGNLGYFTAFQMVYPFESMAYNTPIGKYSDPFKTRFGYHILRVNDIRPARGKVQVAHMMLRLTNQMSNSDSIFVEKKIYQIYDSLSKGGNWDLLCRQYSEDSNTKNSGGVLKPFETGRVVPSFSDAAFSLNIPGEISRPVLTPYGWHIIRLIKKFPLKSYEELKDEITERVKRDSRSELTYVFLIKKLKKENNFQIHDEIKLKCLNMADSSLTIGKWTFDSTDVLTGQCLFTIQDEKYLVADFFNFVLLKQNKNNIRAPQINMNDLMNEYIDEMLIEYEKAHLEEKYYDYKMLVKEYHEGILLFDLMDKKVWNKAIVDTIGLEQFYLKNMGEYQWDERLDAVVFSSDEMLDIEMVRELLDEPYFNISDETLSFPVMEDEMLDKRFTLQIDSLLKITGKDSTQFVEISCNQAIKDILLGYINSKKWDLNTFIFKDFEGNVVNLKIVSNSKKSIEKGFNKNSALTLQVESGFYEKGDNEIIDLIDWKPGIYDLSIENVEYLVYVERLIPAENKQLSEIKGQVISDYQNFLEQEWVEELKNKYSVNVNKNALSNVYRQFGLD